MLDQLTVRTISSLEKVFLDRPPRQDYQRASILRNERFSFQIAYMAEEGWLPNACVIAFSVDSDLKDNITIYRTVQVPCLLPAYPRFDDGYERTQPGFYPDRLERAADQTVKILLGCWQTLWISVQGDSLPPGEHKIKLIFWKKQHTGEKLAEATFFLKVLDVDLPVQTLVYTNWFHADCLASLYRCPVFSPEHWNLMASYIEMAAQFGMNMILTPCFTPPLDTAVGEERLTVQLVQVEKKEDTYIFDFSLLERWMDLCLQKGIRYFEHAHLFTQWGARHAPKIMARVNGQEQQIFGWETDALGQTYRLFIQQYLPALRCFLENKGVLGNFYFHVSDEPQLSHIEHYAAARQMLREGLGNHQVLEAISEYAFYEQGLVDIPIPVTSCVEQFVGKAAQLWTYYTGFQSFQLANRLIAMSSRRNRILGTQLYRHNINGFLHWAFNFYYATLSRKVCDPYRTTDADGEFPSGTAFMVYPGSEGPVPSLRLFVFHEGLQDMRAMQLLQTLTSRDEVLELLDGCFGTTGFRDSPHSDDILLHLREKINRKIAERTERPEELAVSCK
ncbi:MAG: DUF4091 domain-containing protein [Ruminococcaceae bacterium]|nr:DUF4091 domain-containing protein [Oscillospiraceae bacterium]